MKVARTLHQAFGTEWSALTVTEGMAVIADFRDLLREEYDTPDPTMGHEIEQENVEAASSEYVRRIGKGNLKAYAAVLLAGQNRR